MRSLTAILSMLVLLGVPSQSGPVRGPTQHGGDDFQLRINAPVYIAVGDTASTVWVVNDGATVDGVVREGLLVVNGTAKVAGRVEGGIVIVNGRLELAPGARVERDVMLYRSTMTRASDAIVAGVIHDQPGFSLGAGALWVVWLSFTIVVLLAGLLFAELAPRVLTESARYLAVHGSRSAFVALLMAAAVPALAVASFATVIGIPLGLTLLFVVIPALSFLGYLVAGASIGGVLVARFGGPGAAHSRYRPVVLGLIALQILAALPLVGGLIVLVASLVGVGALVARAWSEREHVAPAGVPAAV